MGVVFPLIVYGALAAGAQEVNAQQPPQAFTLHAATRVVLTDVTVTDRNGNPMKGLTENDFHVFDNKVPQTIGSFEEHSVEQLKPIQVTPTKKGEFSNESTLHLPSVVNVLLLDSTNLRVIDQMYLYAELKRFLENFPAGQPLALFLRTGTNCLLLQDFTTDRTLLMAAVSKGVPRLANPDAIYSNDLQTLHDIALYLASIPGRKNLLWFSGGSTFALTPEKGGSVDMEPVYDELEADRISVYPIDARGLTVAGGSTQYRQHVLMDEVAESTGGKAFYNDNSLDATTAKVIETGSSYYTLTYAPKDFRYDNKWHKVTVGVDGGYHLSYRRGYFGDVIPAERTRDEKATRTRLLTDGSRLTVPAETRAPIVFKANLVPVTGNVAGGEAMIVPATPPKRGKERVMVSYTLRPADFLLRQIDGKWKIEVGAAVLLINRDGRQTAQRADKFTVTLDVPKMQQFPNGTIQVSQVIDAGKGDQYLYLHLWDLSTFRRGFLEVPIHVPLAETAQ